VGGVQSGRGQASPLAEQHLVGARAPKTRHQRAVDLAIAHHDRKDGGAGHVRDPAALAQREQRRAGGVAVAKIDGNEQVRQEAPRGNAVDGDYHA
jgi:hypothetical protein